MDMSPNSDTRPRPVVAIDPLTPINQVMVMLADWAQYTVTLQPVKAAASIAPVGLVYKLHVFLGLTLFVLFPFTRLVHIVSAPVWYLGRRYQIVRQKG